MINKKYYSLLAITGIITSLALTSSVFAETNDNYNQQNQGNRELNNNGRMMKRASGIFGTVSTINGTTLTVTNKIGPKEKNDATSVKTPIVYTVDASNAKVIKDNNSSSVSSIAVGDTVMIEGSITGTSVIAKTIRDGIGARVGNIMPNKKDATNNIIMNGNGEPIVAGNVTAINGSSVTITNKSNVTYIIDATNAKIQKGNTLGTIASIKVGDSILAQGTINGTTVTASTIIDQTNIKKESKGFFGAIGSFFGKMFGF